MACLEGLPVGRVVFSRKEHDSTPQVCKASSEQTDLIIGPEGLQSDP